MSKAYVYILGSKGGMLYVGMTNDLQRRVLEHKAKAVEGYTSKYSIDRLLFFEEFNHPIDALGAERAIKGWVKRRKLDLIRSVNPKFEDLSEGWFDG
jgi:putative endonuclease